MERYERPESSKRSEISEHRHDSAEMSPRSQMRDRERAEAGSVQVPRGVVTNWERRVGALMRADLEAGDHSAEAGDHSAEVSDHSTEAGDHSAHTEIKALMEAADEIRKDDTNIASIVYEYAYLLARQLDPLSEGRCVLQFRSTLKAVIQRRNYMRQSGHDRMKDLWVINEYCSELKEKRDIVNLEAEEQAAREGRAPEGEDPSYQAWRTEKLMSFYKISNILKEVAKFLAETVEPDVGSSGVNNPFQHFFEVNNFLYLHKRLFPIDAEVVSYREQPSMQDILSTAANLFTLHNEMLARDLDQFLNDTLLSNSWLSMFSRLGEQVFGDVDMLPMARKLLNLCMKKALETNSYLHAWKADRMNMNQCVLLGERLMKFQEILAGLDYAPPILVLGELLQILHDAQMLIKSNCITSSQWPRAAFEQGDMSKTFSRVLYDLHWHTFLLHEMRLNSTLPPFSLLYHNHERDARRQRTWLRFDLLDAKAKDEKNLEHCLRSKKVADPRAQGLAHQLLNRMEAPFPDLVFLNLDGFDHRGAPLIGNGSFGAVVKYNFLGRQCAMKVIEGARGSGIDNEFEKEMDAIKRLGNHPHLVRLHCYSKTSDACYLIMEELQMDLTRVLGLKDKNDNKLSMVEAVVLMLRIGKGLKHIHDKGAAHRDLKPGNILVNLADPSKKYLSRILSVKIADFGLTKTQAAVITCSNHTRNRGTSVYMAPEVIDLGKDDPGIRFNPAKADVYSFGVVCSEILTGESPYGGPMSKSMKGQVKAGTLRPNLSTNCPPPLATLIRKCWVGNYDERPLLREVCKELKYIKGLLLRYMDRHNSIFCDP